MVLVKPLIVAFHLILTSSTCLFYRQFGFINKLIVQHCFLNYNLKELRECKSPPARTPA